MVTNNIDTKDGLVNGATGILKKLDFHITSYGKKIPIIAWIDFNDENIGKKTRIKARCQDNILTPIRLIQRSFQYKKKKDATVIRQQFPLIPAEGMTVHKSQGSTFKTVAVHTSEKRALTRALLYVACSRVTSLNGLFIVGKFNVPKRNPNVPKPTEIEMELLKTIKKMYYHNVESLNKHFEDITSNKTLLRMDIFIFVETWTLPTDEYLMKNYKIAFRIDSTNGTERKPRGIICFVREELIHCIKILNVINESENGNHLNIAIAENDGMLMIIVYKSPKYTNKTFNLHLKSILNQYSTYKKKNLIGDINEDLILNEKNLITNLLNQHKMKNALQFNGSTTNSGTAIDWVFTNLPEKSIFTQIHEVIFSYHKPIYIEFEKSVAKSTKIQNNDHQIPNSTYKTITKSMNGKKINLQTFF